LGFVGGFCVVVLTTVIGVGYPSRRVTLISIGPSMVVGVRVTVTWISDCCVADRLRCIGLRIGIDGVGCGLSFDLAVTQIVLFRLGGVGRCVVVPSSIASWIGASFSDILVCRTGFLPSPTLISTVGSVVESGFVLFGGFVDWIGVGCSCLFSDRRHVRDELRPCLECRGVGYRFGVVVLVGCGFCCGLLFHCSSP
jgi:hypothetical protein